MNKNPITSKNYFNLHILGIYLLNLILNPYLEISDKNMINLKSNILKTISINIHLTDSEINLILLETFKVSVSKLYQLFNKSFNLTPTKIIQNLKINHACFLLLSSKQTIDEISYQIGYTEATFYKKFNKVIGMSPLVFKKQNLK
ncbi:MAG: helix-turn-helix domain-containing protein [Fusobacteriaceae bacterium]